MPLALADQEKTAFKTPLSNYHYRVILFRLKKCRIHLPKYGDKDVRVQLGRNMEDYIDDMVIKSKVASKYIQDLEEAFSMLRKP